MEKKSSIGSKFICTVYYGNLCGDRSMDITYCKQFEPFWGNWYIKREIGSGSFGKVFEIERCEMGRSYRAALKVVSIPVDESEMKNTINSEGLSWEEANSYYKEIANFFYKECIMMSDLKGNTNIVGYEDHQIHQRADGIGWDIFIRMELLIPLREYLNAMPVTVELVRRLALDMCEALLLCEKRNIIHRDIKPENIFVNADGAFKLGDFGVARLESTAGASTKVGTFDYAAPEVFMGEGRYDSRVDIYSLGMVMYRLLNENRLPFMPLPPATIGFVQKEEAKARRMRGEILPPPVYGSYLSPVILRACEYNPNCRFQTAAEMKQYLIGSLPESDYEETVLLSDGNQYNRASEIGFEYKAGRKLKYSLLALISLIICAGASFGLYNIISTIFYESTTLSQEEYKKTVAADNNSTKISQGKEHEKSAETDNESTARRDELIAKFMKESRLSDSDKILNVILKEFEPNKDKTAFIFYGTQDKESEYSDLFSGQIWYVSDSSVQKVAEGEYRGTGECINYGKKKYVYYDEYATTLGVSVAFEVDDGSAVIADFSGKGIIRYESADEIEIICREYTAGMDNEYASFAGGCDVPYYYEYDNILGEFVECVRSELEEPYLSNCCGFNVTKTIEDKNYTFMGALRDARGYIYINFYEISGENTNFYHIIWAQNINDFELYPGGTFDDAIEPGIVKSSIDAEIDAEQLLQTIMKGKN